jgi:hypothetical protein
MLSVVEPLRTPVPVFVVVLLTACGGNITESASDAGVARSSSHATGASSGSNASRQTSESTASTGSTLGSGVCVFIENPAPGACAKASDCTLVATGTLCSNGCICPLTPTSTAAASGVVAQYPPEGGGFGCSCPEAFAPQCVSGVCVTCKPEGCGGGGDAGETDAGTSTIDAGGAVLDGGT